MTVRTANTWTRSLTAVGLFLLVTPAQAWEKRILDPAKYPDARCNDNTLAVYHVRLAPAGASAQDQRRWHIHLRGGKSCHDLDNTSNGTCYARYADTDTRKLMTSGCTSVTQDPDVCYAGKLPASDGIFSTDSNINAVLDEVNHVYIPYCSSDQHMGSNEAEDFPAAVGTGWPYLDGAGDPVIRFNGHDIVYAVLDDLIDRGELVPDSPQGQTRVLASGSSAGAAGLRSQLDRIEAYLDPAETVGLTDAAMHFVGGPPQPDPATNGTTISCDSTFDNPNPNFSAGSTTQDKFDTWGALDGMDDSCVADRGNPADCLKAFTLLGGSDTNGVYGDGYITTRLFAWSNQLDKLPFDDFVAEVNAQPQPWSFEDLAGNTYAGKQACFAARMRSGLNGALTRSGGSSATVGLTRVFGHCGGTGLHVGLQKNNVWNTLLTQGITYREAVEDWMPNDTEGATIASTCP